MSISTNLLYLFTRTPLHVGSGGSVGVVDQPIQRERHTGYPIIPGSSIKGVLRDHLKRIDQSMDEDRLNRYFGKGEGGGSEDRGYAGICSFMEARLLAFPLRSAKGTYALATSHLALQRYKRDAGLVELEIPEPVEEGKALAGEAVVIANGKQHGIALEEYRFAVQEDFPQAWADHLSGLLDDAVIQGASNRFVLLSDGDFSHFAQAACQVSQHIRIDEKTGTVARTALFNLESVPSETLFYSVVSGFPRNNEDYAAFSLNEQLIQFGGNATTGLGLCTVKLS